MNLTFKDLKQQKFVIEADPSDTVGQVKEKISKEKGWEASLQKLIYSGKILQDANTIESYNIEEKGFIVCMISKPKAAPAASTAKAPSTPAPSTSQTPAAPAAPAPASNTTSNPPVTPTPAGPTTSASATQSEAFNDPSALALGAQRDAAIANMESMGFPRTEIDRAMRAAFFNPDRAVEYLLNGIPEHVQAEQRQGGGTGLGGGGGNTGAAAAASPTANPATTTTPGTGAAPAAEGEGGDQPINLFEAAAQAGRSGSGARSGRSGGGGSGGTGGAGSGANVAALGAGLNAAADDNQGTDETGSLDFLRTVPQFQHLRRIVQTQPRMLEPILQQLGAGNPQLAALIGQHPDQFLQLLSEDADGDAPLPPGAQEISVTEAEREAIERLCRLGFERDLVIQAYFACDKNEELAANFLFDQPNDNAEGGD